MGGELRVFDGGGLFGEDAQDETPPPGEVWKGADAGAGPVFFLIEI